MCNAYKFLSNLHLIIYLEENNYIKKLPLLFNLPKNQTSKHKGLFLEEQILVKVRHQDNEFGLAPMFSFI